MEPRLIYKVAHSITKIEWLNTTVENGAWVFIGDGPELKKEFIFKSIEEFFSDNTLYVSWTRTGSKAVLKNNIELELKGILGENDFSIWDSKFEKVVEFKSTGVMRFGMAEPWHPEQHKV